MHHSRLALAVAVACLAAAVLTAAAQGPATQALATQTRPAPVIDPEARRVLRNAADYFAGIMAFRVTDRTTVKMVIGGAPEQRQSVATLAMERPDRFALRMEEPIAETVVSDGRNLQTYRPGSNRYSVEEATAASLEKLKGRMAWVGVGGRPALSMLIADQPYEVFTRNFSRITYVGTEAVDDVACDRLNCTLSVPSEPYAISVDIWIRSGPQPLPVKVVPALGGERLPSKLKAAQLETVDILQDWWVGDDLPAENFDLEPPPGAVKVARNQLIPPPPLDSMVGKTAPGAALELLEGGRFSLADHLDKQVVVLAFCDPEWPMDSEYLSKLAALARDSQGEDVRFCVVIPAESREAMQGFLAKTPLGMPVALDPKGRLAERYRVVPAITTTVLIDRHGRVQVVQTGSVRKTPEQLRQQIRDVLDGKDLAAEAITREREQREPTRITEPGSQ
jgi:peroxiredoxin